MSNNHQNRHKDKTMLSNKAKQIQTRLEHALALHQSGQFDQARLVYQDILSKHPKNFDAIHLLGVIAFQCGEFEKCIQLISQAITINPYVALAYNNIGNALMEVGRFDEALIRYNKAVALKADYAEAYCNRGDALAKLHRLDQAIESYTRAIQIHPGYSNAYNNLGNSYRTIGKVQEAIGSYQKSLALDPNNAQARYNLGNALKEIRQLPQAIDQYRKTLETDPNHFAAMNNLANILLDLKDVSQAIFYFDKAREIKPDIDFLQGALIHAKSMICEWDNTYQSHADAVQSVRNGKRVTAPFPALGLYSDSSLLLQTALTYATHKAKDITPVEIVSTRPSNPKIRIGYYSADFFQHATAYLMAELFESHDRQTFEIFCFSFGHNARDSMQARIEANVDHWMSVSDKTDEQIATLSRELNIDIAVDLKGYTYQSRPGIFAHRCAPVQVSYLGYPGTMGANFIDYIIADEVVIPPSDQQFFTEKVVYLPGSYQVNDSTRKISELTLTRQEVGLPETGFVFCCFNNNYKITPLTFDSWMRIMKAVSGSVLWLFEGNADVKNNLGKEAESRGISKERLIFAPFMPMEDHLARHRLADLFIDTLPYNAHTTASDALWAGLPLLTQRGKTFAGRVAASLLTALDLPELITETVEEYEARAIHLATHPEELTEIRRKLEAKKSTSSLFDGKQFARHIEEAFVKMHERDQAGLPPDVIYVR